MADLVVILLAFALGMFVLFFMLFYLYFTLTHPMIRTLLVASIPWFKKGRVLNFHFMNSRNVDFRLLPLEGRQLEHHSMKDGAKVTKNKTAVKGSHFIEPKTNTPIFFTMHGDDNSFDPTIGATQSELTEETIESAFTTGSKFERYLIEMMGRPTPMKGITLGFVILMGVLFLAFVLGMLWMVNSNQLTIIELLGAMK